MRKLLLPLFALIAQVSNAQFSILPSIGMEALNTTVMSDNFSAFAPAGLQFAPRVSVRMSYSLKKLGSAFVGVTTGSPAVQLKFTDPATAQTSYQTSAPALQFRLEGGYQFNTKAIMLKKPTNPSRYRHHFSGGQQQAGLRHGSCGGQRSESQYGNANSKQAAVSKGLFMRIKPSIGLAFAPGAGKMETETKPGITSHEYNTGWKTALIAGTAFEFANRNETKFIVSVSYLKSLGNNTQTVYSGSGKTSGYTFQSATSGFNVSIGIPISLSKKSTVTRHSPCSRSSSHGRCGLYKMYNLQ